MSDFPLNPDLLPKVYLVRECAVMHQHKKRKVHLGVGIDVDTESEGEESGVDELYLVRDEEMDIILPRTRYHDGSQSFGDQFVATLDSKYSGNQEILRKVHGVFCNPQWVSPDHIFDGFRAVNQLFIDYKLSGMIKENVKDLRFMAKLQDFYERAQSKSSGLIQEFCSDFSSIHDDVHFQDMESDQITLIIESPKSVLHEEMRCIMLFINQYDDRGRLCCSWQRLKQEMTARNILSAEAQFENLKTLVDQRQFRIQQDLVVIQEMDCRRI